MRAQGTPVWGKAVHERYELSGEANRNRKGIPAEVLKEVQVRRSNITLTYSLPLAVPAVQVLFTIKIGGGSETV
jgi:hypothetical protein